MARASQTETAVLGALSVMPMTGYALRETIREVLGHFWSESYGQIYPTLAALEQQGQVERGSTGRRPGSSTFVITWSGRTRLRELLAQPIQPVPPRNGLLLRLFFGRTLGVDACRALLRETRTEAERRLAGYEALRTEIAAEDEHAADRPYWLLTVSAGEHGARATIAWADEALAALDQLGPRKKSARAHRRATGKKET
jgi:DNA-binding PadR family transcriptional regulator